MSLQKFQVLLMMPKIRSPILCANYFLRLYSHFKVLDQQINELEQQIKHWHRNNDSSRRIEAIPGIGPLTASALIASIGDARSFTSGRQLAAWIGLVPKQHSSGGREKLLGISKRGDTNLRTLLIHGARAVLRVLERHVDQVDSWLARLAARRNANIAAVALANKNARIVWALLVNECRYEEGFRSDRISAAV